MKDSGDPSDETGDWTIVMVTGPSGAGRSTAINALEDLGFETIDNMPLSLLPRLIDGSGARRPLALGIDVRNRDFSELALSDLIGQLTSDPDIHSELVYLDCDTDVLQRRYSETRRRHPLSPEDAPLVGIEAEKELLAQIKLKSDVLINTSELSPHDLKDELGRHFAPEGRAQMAITIESFSYKRGVPRGADMVFDCRFLRNPHWEASLRPLDGRNSAITDYISDDPCYLEFRERVFDLSIFLLPAYRDEGKAHLTIAFGCTGGKHRSVSMVETLAKALADHGWQVNKRHRELERTAAPPQPKATGTP